MIHFEEQLNHLIVQFCFRNFQSFGIAEQTGFTDILNFLAPSYNPPSRRKIQVMLQKKLGRFF